MSAATIRAERSHRHGISSRRAQRRATGEDHAARSRARLGRPALVRERGTGGFGTAGNCTCGPQPIPERADAPQRARHARDLPGGAVGGGRRRARAPKRGDRVGGRDRHREGEARREGHPRQGDASGRPARGRCAGGLRREGLDDRERLRGCGACDTQGPHESHGGARDLEGPPGGVHRSRHPDGARLPPTRPS